MPSQGITIWAAGKPLNLQENRGKTGQNLQFPCRYNRLSVRKISELVYFSQPTK
jgi:hypothetical protein